MSVQVSIIVLLACLAVVYVVARAIRGWLRRLPGLSEREVAEVHRQLAAHVERERTADPAILPSDDSPPIQASTDRVNERGSGPCMGRAE